MAVVQMSINQISNPADQEKLLKVLRECSGAMTRMEGERDYIKESVTEICNQLQLPKKLVTRMVKVYHKQNYDEEVATHEQFETLYETIVK
jgi:hypothetical protein